MSSPRPPALELLHRLDKSSPGFHDQLCNVFYGEGYRRCVPNLQGDDSVWLVNYLDEALHCLDPSSPASRKCLRELRSICGARGILPTSHMLSSDLQDIDPDPFASGGYGDVHKGILDGSSVCVKRVRVYTSEGPQKATKAFCQEAVMWKRLTHPNIVPLLGITLTPLQLVSEWVPAGELLKYIHMYPDVDRLELLSDVAKGLCYLHSCNIVHGDLKGTNILLDDSGHARIIDFGLAAVSRNQGSLQSATFQRGFTPRWSAPELLNDGGASKETDIFSFAMVMIEVFTGAVPFHNESSFASMRAIIQGRRPPRPTHPTFTENSWTLMQHCWNHDPHLRPDILEVLQVLHTPNPPAWKRLISYQLRVDERVSLITAIFSDPGEVEVVGQLSGDSAQTFVDMLIEVVDGLPQQIRRRCLRTLYRICGHQLLIPTPLAVPLCYDPNTIAQCRGGFGDVWKGQYNGQEVAAKVLKLYSDGNMEPMRKRFCREVVLWNTLHHPNVLPLLGVTIAENQLVMVSEWMENGNISQFTKIQTDVNLFDLLEDVTRGLTYMHDQGIVHGDLKGANVLVDRNRRACISDFSLLTIVSDQETFLTSSMTGGTIPWMSPELLEPERFGLKKSRLTKESDRYALGMVIYETLSGRTPFAQYHPGTVMTKILSGERPGRPQGSRRAWFGDGIWAMLDLCWKPQSDERPSLDTIMQCLQGASRPSGPIPPIEDETNTDGQADPATGTDTMLSIKHHPMLHTAIGPPNARGENGIQPPRPSTPPGVTGPTVPQSGNQLSDQQKVGDPQKGWFGSRWARKATKAVAEWVEGL